MWEYPYQYYYRAAFQANAVIDGVADADDDSSEDKRQILGEAYAMRAYAHFDLVNLYGKPYDPQTASTDRAYPVHLHRHRAEIPPDERRRSLPADRRRHRGRRKDDDPGETGESDAQLPVLARCARRLQGTRHALHAQLAGGLRCSDGPAAQIRTGGFQCLSRKRRPAVESDLSGSHIGRERPFGGGNGDLRGAASCRTRSSGCWTKRRTTAATTSTR